MNRATEPRVIQTDIKRASAMQWLEDTHRERLEGARVTGVSAGWRGGRKYAPAQNEWILNAVAQAADVGLCARSLQLGRPASLTAVGVSEAMRGVFAP